MPTFSKDPKKIQATIKRYERALQKEQTEFGSIHDGAGKRHLLGPLYLLKGDLDGALRSFAWFEQTFPDDIGEPGQYLCWTLALYQQGEQQAAAVKLRQTMLTNLYLIPHLLGIQQPRLDMWHSSNWMEPEYIGLIPSEFFQLWDEDALTWAREMYDSEDFAEVRTRYIEIFSQLQHEPVGPKRSQLVKEAFALQER